jgi:hypothetical protein
VDDVRANAGTIAIRMSIRTELDRWLAVESPHLPQYSHHAQMIGSVILLLTIAVIAVVVLVVLWGRRGR